MKFTLALFLAAASLASAATVTFVPPNDTSGGVYSTASNDGYATDRGIVFQAGADTAIDSIGIYQDLTETFLNYTIYQVASTSGDALESGATVLASGGANVTTNGLEWVDFAITPLALSAGSNYEIAFSFEGLSNQNFFYDNQNVPWDQGNFTQLDGASGGNTSNFVVPGIRVNEVSAAPEPASLLLGGLGLVALGLRRFRLA